MKTIKQLIEELEKFPSECFVNAYEGEGIGLVISSPHLTLFTYRGAKEGDGYYEKIGWIDVEPD